MIFNDAFVCFACVVCSDGTFVAFNAPRSAAHAAFRRGCFEFGCFFDLFLSFVCFFQSILGEWYAPEQLLEDILLKPRGCSPARIVA